MAVNKAALKAPSGLLKIVSLILCVIVLILCRVGEQKLELSHGHVDHQWLAYITTGGFTIILGTMILTYLLGETIADKMELIFMVVGSVLFLAMGSLMVKTHQNQNRDYGLATGSLGIITGIVMFVDVVLLAKAVSGRK